MKIEHRIHTEPEEDKSVGSGACSESTKNKFMEELWLPS
jgi:hypothetical protein